MLADVVKWVSVGQEGQLEGSSSIVYQIGLKMFKSLALATLVALA